VQQVYSPELVGLLRQMLEYDPSVRINIFKLQVQFLRQKFIQSKYFNFDDINVLDDENKNLALQAKPKEQNLYQVNAMPTLAKTIIPAQQASPRLIINDQQRNLIV